MADTVKTLAILGSTGSIGRQTLDIVRRHPERYRVCALAGGSNIELLTQQAAEFNPAYIYHFTRPDSARLEGSEFISIEDMASLSEVDIVVMALSGDAGIRPTFIAADQGKTIALANKESLVAAGSIITARAGITHANILPVDSEHSAIWQCLVGEESPPQRIILTASGGPFRHYSQEQLSRVTPGQALNHPSWNMGKKVTIDSATLMNKGLEVIEAHWLFNVPVEKVSVIVHPQSIIHSMVEFADGAVKAQLGCPDMRLPIQYALSYPERLSDSGLSRLDFNTLKSLTFEPPDLDAFPCLSLAIEAGRRGGTYPAVLSAADECAVKLFLDRQIGFTQIHSLVARALEEHQPLNEPSIEDILAVGDWVRQRFAQKSEGDNR